MSYARLPATDISHCDTKKNDEAEVENDLTTPDHEPFESPHPVSNPIGWTNVAGHVGIGGWGDPNHPGWDYSPPSVDSGRPAGSADPPTAPLPDAHQISLPETASLLADLRADFTIENLLWKGQEWRHTHMDTLDSPAWARIQGKN